MLGGGGGGGGSNLKYLMKVLLFFLFVNLKRFCWRMKILVSLRLNKILRDFVKILLFGIFFLL